LPATPTRQATRYTGILVDPGFGRYHTDHMVSIDYDAGTGWHDAAVLPYGPIELDPSAIVLHYAQEIFEGLKAYRWPDGSIVSFRPDANAARMRASAHRLAMPELPDVVPRIAAPADRRRPRLGAAGRRRESLYLRPFMIATEPGLGVRPANQYRYLLIGSPAGAYFKGGVKPSASGCPPSTCGPAPAAPGRPSSAATMRHRCWPRPRPPSTAAIRWSG
jgi:branched-chain amino acid aminotransferase